MSERPNTYRAAGVDIAAGEELVRRIKPLVKTTAVPGVLGNIGAFGGFFRQRGKRRDGTVKQSLSSFAAVSWSAITLGVFPGISILKKLRSLTMRAGGLGLFTHRLS